MPEDSKKSQRSSSVGIERTKKQGGGIGAGVGLVVASVLGYLFHGSVAAAGSVLLYVCLAVVVLWAVLTAIPVTRSFALMPLMLAFGPAIISKIRLYENGEVTPTADMPEHWTQQEREAFLAKTDEVRACGFEESGTFLLNGFNSSLKDAFHCCFVHPRLHEAVVVAYVSHKGMVRGTRPIVEIFAVLGAGKRLYVNDGNQVTMFGLKRPMANHTGLRLADVRTVRELHTIFRGLLQREAPSVSLPVQPRGGWKEDFKKTHRDLYRHWLSLGLLAATGTPGEYRFSLAGSIRAAWGLTWPFAQLRYWLERREFKRRQRDWGLDTGLQV